MYEHKQALCNYNIRNSSGMLLMDMPLKQFIFVNHVVRLEMSQWNNISICWLFDISPIK